LSFEKSFEVAWAMLDANGHMANVAFLDACVDTRFSYFISRGFTPADFVKHGIGPVVRRDEVDYFRELRLLQPFTVSFLLAGSSPDVSVSRFRLRNEVRRGDGELAARITSLGGWLDLRGRKLVAPPPELAAAILSLDRSDDYAELESSLKAPA
jgi:acyl-CoA thioester hydrolase